MTSMRPHAEVIAHRKLMSDIDKGVDIRPEIESALKKLLATQDDGWRFATAILSLMDKDVMREVTLFRRKLLDLAFLQRSNLPGVFLVMDDDGEEYEIYADSKAGALQEALERGIRAVKARLVAWEED